MLKDVFGFVATRLLDSSVTPTTDSRCASLIYPKKETREKFFDFWTVGTARIYDVWGLCVFLRMLIKICVSNYGICTLNIQLYSIFSRHFYTYKSIKLFFNVVTVSLFLVLYCISFV
jgi:hypothetical protein